MSPRVSQKTSLVSLFYRMVFVAFVVVGCLSTVLVVETIRRSQAGSLAERAATIAAALSTDDLVRLSGSPDDVTLPEYQNLKTTLTRIRGANSDLRFAYIFGKRGEEIFFYVDSEPPESEDYSAPGDVYYEATPLLKSVFEGMGAIIEGPEKDRWGTWMSGLAPLANPENGEVVGVVGLDIDARRYFLTVAAYAMVPALITLVAIIIAIAGTRLRRKEEELFRLKFQMLSVASHELRSPLSGIVWGAESILSQQSNMQPREIDVVKRIHDASRYMLTTVADVLDVGRLEAGIKNTLQRELVDIGVLIRETARAISFVSAKERVGVTFDASLPENLSLVCDREKMRRIMSNVIGNALKYAKPGTDVTVSYKKENGNHLFTITDRGIGIPKGEQAKIFRTYYRASNAQKYVSQGTGLGLYFTRELVELHGGRIWFESRENEGTTFYVLLPDAKN